MDNIIVKEYVRGNIRCNVFVKIIHNVVPESSREGYTHVTKRSRNFLKSYRREFTYGMYRFDSYVLGEMETKLIRSMYGPVSLIVYNHFFSGISGNSLRHFTSTVDPYRIDRFDSPGVIFYREYRKTVSASLTTRTTIFLKC